jgi:5-aminolevulinate synthase
VVAAFARLCITYLKTTRPRSRLQRVAQGEMPSQSVMIGEAALAKVITQKIMFENGIYIRLINYPIMPRGAKCLCITPTPLHRDEDEDALIAALVSARNAFPRWREFTDAERSDIPAAEMDNVL